MDSIPRIVDGRRLFRGSSPHAGADVVLPTRTATSSMRTSSFIPLAFAIGAMFAAAGTAHGQRDIRIGNFVDRSTTSPPTILLSPTRAQRDTVGRLMWGCAGTGALFFGIRRPASASSYQEEQDMIWAVDAAAPDTSVIRRATMSRSWVPADEDAIEFTRKAKTAARLMIRLPGAAAGRDAVYEYDLAGAGTALDRLECVRNPRPAREADPPPPPLPDCATGLPDTATYEPDLVDELPRPMNLSDFSRALESNYPPALRLAGVGGEVQARFRVLRDGSVDRESITIVQTADAQLNEPTIRSVSTLHWRPGRSAGCPVAVWVQLPIVWVSRPPD